MLTTLLALLGITATSAIMSSQENQITAIDKKLNDLRNKNDKKSTTLYEKATSMIANNNYLASKLPRYAKIVYKDNRELESKRQKVLDKQNDINTDITNAQTANNARYNHGIIDKAIDLFNGNRNQNKIIDNIDKEI